MSEVTEIYREMRQYAAEKRRRNKECSTAMLRENGIVFETKNNGAHLIIRTAKGTVNFFPSTGLYNGVLNGRGVLNLLKELETEE